MHIERLLDRMASHPGSLRVLLSGIPPEDARWRPPEGGWSILEIVNHLADEEVEDFRARIQATLADAGRPWPPIDPVRAVTERDYNARDLVASLQRFEEERARSLQWLRAIADSDWSKAHRHPKLGVIRAGDLLASLAAHDALHLRQLARRLFDLTLRDTAGWSVAYAGDWPDRRGP